MHAALLFPCSDNQQYYYIAYSSVLYNDLPPLTSYSRSQVSISTYVSTGRITMEVHLVVFVSCHSFVPTAEPLIKDTLKELTSKDGLRIYTFVHSIFQQPLYRLGPSVCVHYLEVL